jgi:hypothetical protein
VAENPKNNQQTTLPRMPSATGLNMQNYRNPTTPAANRLNVSPQIQGPATGNQRLVYMGMQEVQAPAGIPFKNVNQPVKKNVPYMVPVADARYMMYTLAPDAKKQLDQVTTAYFGHNRWDPSWQDNVWEQAIQVSANAKAYANQNVTPVDAFQMIVSDMAGASGGGRGKGGGGGGGGGPTTTTTTSTSISLTDPGSARALVNKSLTDYLGREASESEQEKFMQALNAAERRNPTVTRQTTRSVPGRGTSTVTQEAETRQGFNPSTFAQEYAQSQEGAAEYQAATNLLDVFIGSLKARV